MAGETVLLLNMMYRIYIGKMNFPLMFSPTHSALPHWFSKKIILSVLIARTWPQYELYKLLIH